MAGNTKIAQGKTLILKNNYKTTKKQPLPLITSKIIQIWWMETYADFGVSSLIQFFVNKILLELHLPHNPHILHPPPNFTFSERKFTIYETSENVLFELKRWWLPSLSRSHDVTIIVGKQVVLLQASARHWTYRRPSVVFSII